AYSNNNPINASDPTGLALEECASGFYRCSHGGTQVEGPGNGGGGGGGLPGGCSAFAYTCGTGAMGTSDCATNWHPPCAPITNGNLGTVVIVNERPGSHHPSKSGDGGGGGSGGGGGGGGNGRGTKKCGSWFSLDGAGCHISNGAKRTQNFTTDHPAVRAIVVTTVEIAAGTMCYAGGAAGALETGGATAVAAVAGCGAAVGALGSGLDNMLDGNADHSIKGQALAEVGGAISGAEAALTDGLMGPKGPCNSFPAGTQVLLGDGSTKAIDQLTTADQVTATDPQTGVTAPKQVLATIVGHGDQDYTDLALSTSNGDRAPPAPLTSTQHHPFWDITTNRWTDAADLTTGDQLRQADGTTVTVESVHNYRTAPQTAYNLTVDDVHTYYVLAGTTPVLVHNCPISMDEAIDRAIAHVGDLTTAEIVKSGSGAVQWQREFINEVGERITKIARFDINPSSRHVQQSPEGPHLNLETQVNGKTVKKGPLKDPHTPIDPNTIRPGDYH
uniref:polymorphic toxin-type HINT domain-containing protein n=1 Tax=Kitasatospora sp. MBT63 TaxID=1444768 RepID=UPI00053B18E2